MVLKQKNAAIFITAFLISNCFKQLKSTLAGDDRGAGNGGASNSGAGQQGNENNFRDGLGHNFSPRLIIH
jgi:hypothetical protein